MEAQLSRHVTSFTVQPRALDSAAGTIAGIERPLLPILDGLSIRRLTFAARSVREPHAHPDTAEMGYVLEGRGRMTVLDPDGSAGTYLISAGDVYFIPPAYLHHIENIGEGVLHILILFSRGAPPDIGYRAAAAGFSRSLIAAELNVAEQDLPPIPVDFDDPLIVPQIQNS